jgi:Uma2 family endonuclease
MARLEPPVKTGLTFEDYLAFEETSAEKHEFVDGQLFMMAGTTERHNRIAGRMYATILAAEDGDCKTYFADVKVQTPNDVGYYPDVLVSCDVTDDHPIVKRKPCLIVEVLSDRTEAIDRGEKLGNYRLFPSLQAYVLVNQNAERVEIYERDTNNFWRYKTYEAGETFRLPCVNLDLTVDSLYQNL